MKVFSVFSKKQVNDYFKDVIYIEEEFSVGAACFSWVWALYCRMWCTSVLIFLAYFILYLLFSWAKINQEAFMLLFLALSLYIGSFAKDWYAKSLTKKGYDFKGVIAAHNLEEAQLKYIAQETDKAMVGA
ncbi:hypothetical protein I862_02690 [endosymbiont of Acanthamoeba sp. UWC8]|uniref:hypothetical protein n=1 Tax=endosymbiont of Acanthamoeba sp. UWC8 TaxID=86106 RepID=UPI0004D1E042|nr:hypothetical protein [endosymbiont of Acanthamoeba sp. UWC8]AIF81101.1 hypothetical protein I862_02690 [endosymbiont of Acanthamoeba sp. UWC8]